jgi:hypothetical protein
VPEYNDGTTMTISVGDTCFVLSINKDVNDHIAKFDRLYYYYHHNQVHCNRGAFIGFPLNDVFIKQTRNGKLIEKGFFKKGLKHGLWCRWYGNGELKERVCWRRGRGKGKKTIYTDLKEIKVQYKWKKGRWVLTRKYERMHERIKREKEKEKQRNIRKAKRLKNKRKFFPFNKDKEENVLGSVYPNKETKSKATTEKETRLSIIFKKIKSKLKKNDI